MWKLLVGSGLDQVPVRTPHERAPDSRVGHCASSHPRASAFVETSLRHCRAHANSYLGICPLMTHKEASGLGRVYTISLSGVPEGMNGPPQFLRSVSQHFDFG